MKKNFEIVKKTLNLAKLYLPSAYGGFKNRKLFENMDTYCMFIGYPRSGHSLIGTLLDAHPNMIIAPELDALKYIHARFSKRQISYLIVKRSQMSAETRFKRKGYLYVVVPNQWNGKIKSLRVIGDKHGESSSIRLKVVSDLLGRLRNTFNINIKFIHVIRNPFDNISTICRKADRHKLNPGLKHSINYYFSLCKMVLDIKKQIKCSELFELRYELFIEDPKIYLKELCQFLGLDASDDYLNDCASIVFKSPHKSRCNIQWNQELIDNVKNRINEFPFLQGYSYSE